MTQIASEDYDNLLIYLHVDTVTQGWSPLLMQQEHRQRRRLDANGERGYDIMVTFQGNEAKGGGNFTAPLTKLRSGVRVVPYDTGAGNSYNLDILDEIVNIDDAISDRDVLDRSGVDSTVNADPTYSPVEVRQISTGSGVTQQDKDDIENQIFGRAVEGSETFEQMLRLIRAMAAGDIVQQANGDYVIKGVNGTTDRIDGSLASNNGRTINSTDGS